MTNVPGLIHTNFMPMLLVKYFGGSFGWAWVGTWHARKTTRLRQKRRVMTNSSSECVVSVEW